MKKIFFLTILAAAVQLSLFAQADFSGSADIGIYANLPQAESFSSILSRSDLGVEDISMIPSFIAKLDTGDEKTSFSAWFSMKEFPIGQGLLAAAYSDPAQTGAVFELVSATGDKIYSFDLMRLSANIYLADNISMEVGRQSMLTGYGYGWNPIDFANPLKNPADPDAELRGVDAATLRMYLNSNISFKLYGILPETLLSTGIDYEEIKPGGELTMNFPGIELKLSGLWDYDTTEGSDAYTPAAGAAVMLDLFGIGVYGEAAAREGSRNYSLDGITRKTDWLFSGLAGLEYTFESELYAVIEYFYNGEGFNKAERAEFQTSMSFPTFNLLSTYTPGYFAEHYILINLMQPFYDIDTDLNLSAIYSPDSGALTLMPSVNYSFSGNFSAKMTYTGMFDLSNNDFNEITALPVRHIVSTVFTYSF
ncbi:MAG: hypothetical protein J7L71_03225 [Spirochaetaceae bacterium]|nr:hypothetical protein [Spirochaetaceae bacterium]